MPAKRTVVKNERSSYFVQMARVSQEHLDARRLQILDAARRCFIRNGFHATSMQDVFNEAGLSAGAVYRYFVGKDDIIAAIASGALADLAAAFSDGDQSTPQLDDFVDVVLNVDTPPLAGSTESARLLVQIWSEALRSPSLAEQLTDVMDESRRLIARLVERHQRAGLLSSEADPEQVAAVLIALVDGFMVQRAVYARADAESFRAGIRALMGRAGTGR
jgi:TetR/AcrR family transcriptional regulator, transcriptional repressor of aconitase